MYTNYNLQNLSNYEVILWRNRFGLPLSELHKVWSFISRIQKHPEELFPEAQEPAKKISTVSEKFEKPDKSTTEQPEYIEFENESEEEKKKEIAKHQVNSSGLYDDEGYLLMARMTKPLEVISNNIYEAEPKAEVKAKVQSVGIPRKTYDPESLKNRPLPPVPVENQPKPTKIDKKENPNKIIEISGSIKQIAPPKKTYTRNISQPESQDACKNLNKKVESSDINDMLSKELHSVWEKQQEKMASKEQIASPQLSRKPSIANKLNISLPTPPPLSIEQDIIKSFEKVVKDVDDAPPAKYTLGKQTIKLQSCISSNFLIGTTLYVDVSSTLSHTFRFFRG